MKLLAALLILLFPTPVRAQSQTGPISGYMELHLNRPDDAPAVLDFHRFVLLFNHSFTDRIRFVGELELEHAFVEGLEAAGELELEQGYLDFLIARVFNVRAGMMLVPLGIQNERHEPPVFQGVERTFVDTVIIPTTWFEVGAGVHGEVGRGWRYRAFVMAPLNALEFSAEEGIRGGRQKGSQADVSNVAYTGRLEYLGIPGLQIGAGGWRGESSFAVPRLDSEVWIAEADARYRVNRLELRAQYAHVGITDAARLNDAIERTTGVSPNIARQLRGFYVEGAYRVWNAGPARDLVLFARHENFDTQFRMPEGFLPLEEFDRTAWVLGATYYPDPDVAVKFDYTLLHSRSGFVRLPRTINIGLGWWF
ncbi:MAG TPA: hypothetical protein VFZ36_05880 [Vicinamibacterales bacterium]